MHLKPFEQVLLITHITLPKQSPNCRKVTSPQEIQTTKVLWPSTSREQFVQPWLYRLAGSFRFSEFSYLPKLCCRIEIYIYIYYLASMYNAHKRQAVLVASASHSPNFSACSAGWSQSRHCCSACEGARAVQGCWAPPKSSKRVPCTCTNLTPKDLHGDLD